MACCDCHLLLLKVIFSRFTYGVAILHFFTAKYYSIIIIVIITRVGHILFVHSSVDGHLGYSRILVITSNAALSILVQIFVEDFAFISLGAIPWSGIVGSNGNCI